MFGRRGVGEGFGDIPGLENVVDLIGRGGEPLHAGIDAEDGSGWAQRFRVG